MKRFITLSLVVLISSCSVPFNRTGPVFKQLPDGTQKFVGGCQQSNFAAGLDLTVAALLGLTIAVMEPQTIEQNRVQVALAFGPPTLIGSAVYGFVRSAKCRQFHRDANIPVFGGSDWVWPPLITAVSATVLAAAAMTPNSSNAATSHRQDTRTSDTCDLVQPPTMTCNDGQLSCASQTRGACSHHGGISCVCDPEFAVNTSIDVCESCPSTAQPVPRPVNR